MAAGQETEQYDHSLDQEYASCLQMLRNLIPGLEEPIDIKITAQWIDRFNNTPPDQKALRNYCAKLLLQQLLEDNLTHPFIFPHLLDEPLEVLLQNDPELMSGVEDPFEPLQHLVKQFETLNERTDEDICSLQADTSEKPTDPAQSVQMDLSYLLRLQDALRTALLLRVPDIIETPEMAVPAPSEKLHQDDRQWLTIVLEGIRAKVSQKQDSRSTCTVQCQTINEQSEHVAQPNAFTDRTEIERYMERKFAKLYAKFRVREKALEIRTQTAGGIHLIDVSQRLVKQGRRSFPATSSLLTTTTRQKAAGTTDRSRRRSDN